MVIDASVLVAILLDEPDADGFIDRLEAAETRVTHPISIHEAATALAREGGSDLAAATEIVMSFLRKTNTGCADIGPGEAMAAIEAFSRFGQERHLARLNIGDCFSYAVAKVRGMPLLYKGDDFARTDLA